MPGAKRLAQTRRRHHNTPFAKRRRRLGLNVAQAARWLREPYGTVRGWNQGRYAPPRAAMRLLAVYRLLHWGKY